MPKTSKTAGLKKTGGLTFETLINSIRRVNTELYAQAGRAVNISITLRNWIIGRHITEYELRGLDRARYGDKLLARLSARLQNGGVSRCEERELRRYRQFYLAYPQIRESLSPELEKYHLKPFPKFAAKIREASSPVSGISVRDLITKLSFSHIAELLGVPDPHARAFYEAACLGGGWTVRELKRQIASLYFERSGLSRNKKKLAALVRRGAEKSGPGIAIRDPYIF